MLNKGALLIPAFSIGRTQEILYELEGLIHKHADRQLVDHHWRDIEMIVDSPLASKFTHVYKSLKSHWDSEARRRVRSGDPSIPRASYTDPDSRPSMTRRIH